mgnify:CR=1 FL=1
MMTIMKKKLRVYQEQTKTRHTAHWDWDYLTWKEIEQRLSEAGIREDKQSVKNKKSYKKHKPIFDSNNKIIDNVIESKISSNKRNEIYNEKRINLFFYYTVAQYVAAPSIRYIHLGCVRLCPIDLRVWLL